MSGAERGRLRLLIAIALSIGLHAAVLFGTSSPSETSTGLTAAVDPPEQILGVESSQAVTITWIGFEEASPHSARPSEQDQAQLTRAAGQQAVAASAAAAVQATAQASRSAERAIESLSKQLSALAREVQTAAAVARREREAQEAAERARQASEARRQAAASPEGETGEVDDRESDATAREATLDYAPGRPVARQGLRIQTIRPVFDSTTRLLELRRLRVPPTVAVTFGRDGAVIRAGFVENSATGAVEVDDPILNAVHAWRAAGSDLEAIPSDDPNAGVTVRIRFRF